MKNLLNLSQQINYQKGAVVSKEILKKETGTITLFAFDEGQGLSEHTAPYEAFVFVLDGKAEITVNGVVNSVAAGGSILMPANSPHAIKATKSFKMLLTMIKS